MPPGIRPPHAGQSVTFLLIPALGEVITMQAFKPMNKKWHAFLVDHIRVHFDEPYEHVAVLYHGERRDMFVGETSSINGRHIRNARATAIYRANTLGLYQGLNLPEPDPTRRYIVAPESLPAISGPAVLFPDVIVWR